MASRSMYASMLPSVKCSRCGDEIQISLMGDHICAGTEKGEQTETQTVKPEAPRIPTSIIEEEEEEPTLSHPDTTQNTALTPMPLETGLTVGLKAPSAPLTPTSPLSQPSTWSEPIPPRAVTDTRMYSSKPPSPPPEADLKTTSVLKPSPDNSEQASDIRSQTITYAPKVDTTLAPLSPRQHGATGLLQRMHTIAPGPFHLKKPSLKKPSVDRTRSSKDAGISHISSPSLGGVGKVDYFGRPLPTGPPPPRPARPDDKDEPVDSGVSPANEPTLDETERGRTLEPQPVGEEPVKPLPQRPRSRSRSASRSYSQSSSQPDSDTVPPLPSLSQLQSHSSNYQQHTPTDSVSSNGSRSMYDDHRTESSRSSAPTSHASSLSQRNLSMDGENERVVSGSEYSSVAPTLLPSSTYQPRSSSLRRPPRQLSGGQHGANFSRPRPPESVGLGSEDHTVDSHSASTDPTMDQTLQDSALLTKSAVPPPRNESLSQKGQRQNNTTGDQSEAPATATDPQLTAVRQQRRCKACQVAITGKSVKDGSGRLRGRYHKECFVCRTCREPFPTAEFYVLNDQPYCARHYHTLNDSLCAGCNWGIEGTYLETDGRRKYHTTCFSCRSCGQCLPRDYYEINGMFYCEQDAMRIHQTVKTQTPGKRFPERRQTRQMMM